MESLKLKALRVKRTGLRTSFTKTANVVKVELSEEEFSSDVVRDKITKLTNVQLELRTLDNQILDLLVSDENTLEEDVNKEIEQCEMYSDEFITLSRQVNEKFQNPEQVKLESRSADSADISLNRIKQYRLPKIELKKFDGEFINWLPFWSQFEKTHSDPDLYESDKFAYLIQCMKFGSRAREFIESYPVTSENYDKAVSALKERFGKPELLVEVYVRELIKLIVSNVKANSKDKLSLDKLYDKIEAHLRALKSLGLKSHENTAWLFPMVESCLTEDVLKAWQRSSLFNEPEGVDVSRLSNLMKFLKAEVEGEERLKLARSGLDNFSHKDGNRELKGKFKFQKQAHISTASSFLSTKDRACLFCDKMHDCKNCYGARALSLNERIAKVKEKKCCLKCLEPNHIAKFCKQFIKCFSCGKAHLNILCPELNKPIQAIEEKTVAEILHTTTVGQTCTPEVALMTLWVKVAGVKECKEIRALLDCGSQKSYILESLAIELELPVVSKENVALTLFGGTKTEPKLHNKYRAKLCSVSSYRYPNLEFEFLDQKVICGDIPRVPKGPILKQLKRNRIWLSDLGENCPKIEMLIGSDIYGKILTGRVKQLKGGLTAICTKLGWTVCGVSDDFHKGKNASAFCTNLAIQDFKISDLWSLETIGILDANLNLNNSLEEKIAREQFLNSLSRNEEGRYSVGLPWLGCNVELPSNRHIAEKRLFNVTHRLKSLRKYEEYDNIFKQWLEEGVVEAVPNNELHFKGHYLPHHPVFKPSSVTTKIRPVFDASCKVNRSPSLNDCLVKGPNLIEEIPSILLGFREKSIGVTSDIRRAFLQIELRKEDRDFLRFLWWEKGKLKVLRRTRVVFGVRPSPFLLGVVISFHLSKVPPDQNDIARKLDRAFYIDNCVTSVDNEKDLVDFVKSSTEILAEARMDLRMWTYGPAEKDIELAPEYLSADSPAENPVLVLGIMWDRKLDNLHVKIENVAVSEKVTKREVLSLTQSIFDPLGFLTPVLLQAKLLLQEIWEMKVDWDAPLPGITRNKFLKWYNQLKILNDLRIPRRIGFGDRSTWSLHIFCDASQHAYATVIFLRSESEGEIFVRFVAAKSRVTPLKGITIPRLELMSCVLGVRLSKYVSEALALHVAKYFWTDSSTALFWIQRNDAWGTFVGNRVREICSVTNTNQWSHISSHLNFADLPSRGCLPLQYSKSDWWSGPVCLKSPKDNWPKSEVKASETLVFAERKKGICLNLSAVVESDRVKWYEKFSKFSKMIPVLSWVKRFIKNCQKVTVIREPFLLDSEIKESKIALLALVQTESFPEMGDSIGGILTIRDQSGLRRVRTRIVEREDSYEFRYPILLPSKHYIVNCFVRDYHLKYSHAGTQALTVIMREEFWIIGARRIIRSIVKNCVRCKRFAAKPPTTGSIQLPLDRVRDAFAFEVTGIDLCGPLILWNKTKTWIVLFTCAVYRCVHLELVSSISTETFIQALRRFIARRGRPSVVYTDNGTNFVGASRLLRKIEWKKVISLETLSPITWNFIPPTAAWWGGWWERLVRTTKELLVRVLGQASVTYEELLILLCDVESVMNCRPLTYVSNDTEDLTPLTPSMFIQDIKFSGTPDLDLLDRDKLLVRQRFCQELREQLRSRFRKEYLGQLVQRHGQTHCELKLGDIVLVGSENLKRINWPIARIQELYTGRDGRVRVVKVKTQNVTKLNCLGLVGNAMESEAMQKLPSSLKFKQIGTKDAPFRVFGYEIKVVAGAVYVIVADFVNVAMTVATVAVILGSALPTSKVKIDLIQYRAPKIITSSTNNIKAGKECGITLLDNRRKLSVVKFTNKIQSPPEYHISSRTFRIGAASHSEGQVPLKLRNHPIHRQVIATNKSCTLQWIPAHVNILGNEKTDEVAKESRFYPLSSNLPLIDADAVASRRFISNSFKTSIPALTVILNCNRTIASIITRLRTKYVKGMKISNDGVRRYSIHCPHCPDFQLSPQYGFACPAIQARLLKISMDDPNDMILLEKAVEEYATTFVLQ
ncbi:uncharacterized protein LOC129223104 [Uloborus diversus]|uniref:uncharacterized protein LOC129223104 n=1 Tax=Uloborus diversus TaxID=327109 RepID=UPI002409B517|nr:uncharacterized protein LOC129223104 [Uloborus diversus]